MPESTISPYNTVLSTHFLIENTDLIHVFDNYQLSKLCEKNVIL